VLSTAAMRVVVNLKAFSFDLYRSDGSVIVRSVPGQAYASLNEMWAVSRFKTPDDSFLGFGEKAAFLNHNGQYLQMWNVDMIGEIGFNPFFFPGAAAIEGATSKWANPYHDPLYISIPFYYHLPAGHPELASASFIENGYHLHYNLTVADTLRVVGEGGQLTEYFFAGPTIKSILAAYTELTGRMKAPPLWSLGHHQCRWYNYVERDIYDLARNYREKKIPNDSFWLDIDYMDGYRIFTWDTTKFPDIRRLTGDIAGQGFRMVTIIDPGVKYDTGYRVFDEGVERNLFCKTRSGKLFLGKVWPGLTAFPDFVKEDTRDWWAGWIGVHADAMGLGGIWIDMNEPAFDWAPKEHMRFDRDGADYEHERYHNQYGFLMARATDEGLLRSRPGQRSFVLSRSGYAGIQRYAANWTGDNPVSWAQFRVNIPMNLNIGLSGQPFTGSDIRGGDEELFIRFYQYAMFYPFARNHSGNYPWNYGARVESAIRKAIEFRYQLLPYLYTAMMRASETGEPVMRPLVYEFQYDPAVTDRCDEFLFGDHLLVAPVMTKGAVTRSLYLPRGDWYRFGQAGALAGERTVTVDAPLTECPVFVRGGAVIPSADVVQSTAFYHPEEVTLLVYLPLADGEYVSYLHEDDGATFDYLTGSFFRTVFRIVRAGKQVTLTAVTTGNGYAGFSRTRFRIRVIGDQITERVITAAGKGFTLTLRE
jgi:alpha-glucosidase